MADKKISQLSQASTLGNDDVFVAVQGGQTMKIPASVISSEMQKLDTVDTVIATGALSSTTKITKIQVGTGANYTLTAGVHGVEKTIVCHAITTGSSNVVCTTVSGGASGTLTFSAVGQTATLKNVSGTWFVTSLVGATKSGF